MRVEIEYEALQGIVRQAVFLGQIQYRSMVTPASNRIKQREARRYLQQIGYKPSVLDEWVEHGYVHRHQNGERNSAVYYSLMEIQRQVVATEAKKGKPQYLYL